MEPTTLARLLGDGGSNEPAILDDAAGVTISYRMLAEQVERLAGQLRGAGLRPGDAVAHILPNGIEMLVTLLAVVRAGLVAVPLDPASKPGELRTRLVDTTARAIVTSSSDAVAAATASELGAHVMTAALAASGVVELAGMGQSARDVAEPGPDDVALFLHTSGTEGKPKVVPLTHANVSTAARRIAAHYALTPADRSLIVVPLFHGHGLIGAVLSTLASGGAAIVSPRFSASGFWRSFHRHRATWFTAVPTIHQILLTRADRDGAPHAAVRFIRSCSAPLAPAVLAALERRYGAPVVEAYGLTEAAHQVASNPLPPGARKPGTVGPGVGAEIAIVDPDGHRLAPCGVGEIILRGPSVMRAYRGDPIATAAAFLDGWFRTGDLGSLDDDGFLSIEGRIKEIINRGGEKISPVEIDDVLLMHPAVSEAAAFGVPDAKYGEVVEAAVVLKGVAEPEELQTFCRARLADFKVPVAIRIVARLPRNALGKVQRHALAALYPLAG